MRSPAFGAPAVLLCLAAAASAAPVATPDVRYVKDAEAEVRCQPSTKAEMYATNRLRRGDSIEVVEELPGGWLKIRPPRGSFSWINVNNLYHIAPNQPNEVITTDEPAPVYIGSEVQKGRPTVVGARLKRGTQVRSIGRPLAGDSTAPGEAGPWMPIEAPEGEFRYIRAEAVAKDRPAVDTVAAARAPNGAPAGSTFTPLGGALVSATAPPASNAITPVPDVQALYGRALEAERAGNLHDAILLWEQVTATLQNQGRTQEAGRYAARARELRQAPQGGSLTLPSETRYPTPAGQRTDPTVRLAAPPGTTPSAGTPANSGPGTLTARGSAASGLPSSGPGRLRRAGRAVEYQRTYVLENDQGLPLLYVAPAPGLDLEPYVNHNVELFGHAAYRGDIRAYYMTVARVQPLP
jgi:hypothetical protein